MTAGNVFFLVCGVLALLGAVWTIAAKSAIRSAVGLLFTIAGIAGLFLKLNAQFLAAIQLIVYAGAVVVLFVFVIMLIGAHSKTSQLGGAEVRVSRAIAGAVVGTLGVVSVMLIGYGDHHVFQVITPAHGSVDAVGRRIFQEGLVPFELVTVLLIVAVVGAIAVARAEPRQHKKGTSPGETNATKRLFHGPIVAKDGPWAGDQEPGDSEGEVQGGSAQKESA